VLIDYIDSVEGNACLAALASGDRDSGVTRLRRIEGLAVLDLDARLKGRQLEIIASVERQLIDLARSDDTAHGDLFGVHLNGTGANLDLGAGRRQCERDLKARRLAYFDHDLVDRCRSESG